MPEPMMAPAGGGSPSPMAEDESSSMDKPEGAESGSIFIPKDALGGKQYKAGDTLTLTVKDVDQETGEVEAECEGGDMGSSKRPGYEEAIDNMPEKD